jgi:hypothetical protein
MIRLVSSSSLFPVTGGRIVGSAVLEDIDADAEVLAEVDEPDVESTVHDAALPTIDLMDPAGHNEQVPTMPFPK